MSIVWIFVLLASASGQNVDNNTATNQLNPQIAPTNAVPIESVPTNLFGRPERRDESLRRPERRD